MQYEQLLQDVLFVGTLRKISWLKAETCQKSDFLQLLRDIQSRGDLKSIRNVLYSMLCVAEFLDIPTRTVETFSEWYGYMGEKKEQLIELASKGTQGNIPQRAAIVLDYMARYIQPKKPITIVELGCSGGLLGEVFVGAQQVFAHEDPPSYFWLRKVPQIPKVSLAYIGCDQEDPDESLLPFYIWDEGKRTQVQEFIRRFPRECRRVIISIDQFLNREVSNIEGDILFLTSFVLYQMDDAQLFVRKLLERVQENAAVHWVDLSRARDFLIVSDLQMQQNRVYLFHNGKPQARVIDGSDDCPNWAYLESCT